MRRSIVKKVKVKSTFISLCLLFEEFHVRFGNKKDILKMLEIKENGYIDTSYVERFNLTIRASLARFIRKGMNFSKK